ncbi:hypothetical protein VNO80_19018 [Phaseolus coccineus]|uniref:Uncharacterized protein n=1 Tax=Phaseolus coccineus TaxID=3886 RepID=A0AAN9R4C1_PHACN
MSFAPSSSVIAVGEKKDVAVAVRVAVPADIRRRSHSLRRRRNLVVVGRRGDNGSASATSFASFLIS